MVRRLFRGANLTWPSQSASGWLPVLAGSRSSSIRRGSVRPVALRHEPFTPEEKESKSKGENDELEARHLRQVCSFRWPDLCSFRWPLTRGRCSGRQPGQSGPGMIRRPPPSSRPPGPDGRSAGSGCRSTQPASRSPAGAPLAPACRAGSTPGRGGRGNAPPPASPCRGPAKRGPKG